MKLKITRPNGEVERAELSDTKSNEWTKYYKITIGSKTYYAILGKKKDTHMYVQYPNGDKYYVQKKYPKLRYIASPNIVFYSFTHKEFSVEVPKNYKTFYITLKGGRIGEEHGFKINVNPNQKINIVITTPRLNSHYKVERDEKERVIDINGYVLRVPKLSNHEDTYFVALDTSFDYSFIDNWHFIDLTDKKYQAKDLLYPSLEWNVRWENEEEALKELSTTTNENKPNIPTPIKPVKILFENLEHNLDFLGFMVTKDITKVKITALDYSVFCIVKKGLLLKIQVKPIEYSNTGLDLCIKVMNPEHIDDKVRHIMLDNLDYPVNLDTYMKNPDKFYIEYGGEVENGAKTDKNTHTIDLID